MSIFENSDQLYNVLKLTFSRLHQKYPQAARKVTRSRLLLRMRTSSPYTETNINGRHNPVEVTYGPSNQRADIELDLPAGMLHQILMGELSLKTAYASGKIKLRGPLWRALILADIFHYSQAVYPQVLKDQGI